MKKLFLPFARVYIINKCYICGAFAKLTYQNMANNEVIRHDGVVKSVEDECVRVLILQSSACSGCAVKQMCSSAEAKEKEVEVRTADADQYRVGQKVELEGRLSDGRMAAIIAYGLPLVLLLPTLFISVYLSGSETLGALWALLTVAFYYIFVYVFLRKRLQQRFSFKIASIIENL